MTLDYPYRGGPFVRWITADVDTGTLDYPYQGGPYCQCLGEDTTYLELVGSIDAVSSLSGTLFQNEFAELVGSIDAVSGLSATLGIDIALSGAIAAVSDITETAFLQLDLEPEIDFDILSGFSISPYYEYIEGPVDPGDPNFWEDIIAPSEPVWEGGADEAAFWRPIDAKDTPGWVGRESGSQFWRHILKTDKKTWNRGDINAEQIPNS